MTSHVQTQDLARGVLDTLDGDMLVLAVPGTEYKLHLVPTVPADRLTTPQGKRIKGTIQAKALRMHTALAGGRFIEPVWGAPRIVQGAVVAIDEPAQRVLIDVSIPMWVTVADGQRASNFHPGELVNFYVQSGTSFTPSEP